MLRCRSQCDMPHIVLYSSPNLLLCCKLIGFPLSIYGRWPIVIRFPSIIHIFLSLPENDDLENSKQEKVLSLPYHNYIFMSCVGVGYTISKNTFFKTFNNDRSSFPFSASINLDLTMILVKSSIFSPSSKKGFLNA
jgi:hypothetical protein